MNGQSASWPNCFILPVSNRWSQGWYGCHEQENLTLLGIKAWFPNHPSHSQVAMKVVKIRSQLHWVWQEMCSPLILQQWKGDYIVQCESINLLGSPVSSPMYTATVLWRNGWVCEQFPWLKRHRYMGTFNFWTWNTKQHQHQHGW